MVLTTVLFPAYSAIRDDAAQLRETFCTVVKYTALVAVPISTGLVAVAPQLVTVLFGAKWVPSVPILQVLALVALVASLAWSAGDVFKALGHPQIQTRIVLIEGVVTLPAVVLLTWLTGEAYMAAAGLLAGVIVSTAARLFLVRRHLAISRRDLARLYAGPLFGGGAILFTVYAAQQFAVGAPAGLVLAISVVLGACVYGGAVWFVDRAAIEHLGALTRRNRSIEQGRRVLAGTAGRLK
jgi:O-antigen/teichoic acid export membrane protein